MMAMVVMMSMMMMVSDGEDVGSEGFVVRAVMMAMGVSCRE